MMLASCQPNSSGTTAGDPSASVDSSASALSKVHQLYVHDRRGLVLRTAPSPDAERVATLVYGDSVTTTTLDKVGEVHVDEKIGPRQIADRWHKVISSKGQEGYLFAAYLFAAPTLEPSQSTETYLEWFYPHWAAGAKVASEGSEPADFQEGAIDGRKVIFEDGANYEFAMYEGGVSEYLRIPVGKISIEAAFVLFRAAFYGHDYSETKYDGEDKSLVVRDEVSALVVSQEEGYIVIALHAS